MSRNMYIMFKQSHLLKMVRKRAPVLFTKHIRIVKFLSPRVMLGR